MIREERMIPLLFSLLEQFLDQDECDENLIISLISDCLEWLNVDSTSSSATKLLSKALREYSDRFNTQ